MDYVAYTCFGFMISLEFTYVFGTLCTQISPSEVNSWGGEGSTKGDFPDTNLDQSCEGFAYARN